MKSVKGISDFSMKFLEIWKFLEIEPEVELIIFFCQNASGFLAEKQ